MEDFHSSWNDDDNNLTAMVGRLAPSRSSIQNRAHSATATTTATTTTASAAVGETPSARALAYEYGSRSCDYINTVAYTNSNNAWNNHYRNDGAIDTVGINYGDIKEYDDDGKAAKMMFSIRNSPAIKPASKRIRSAGTNSDIPPFRYNNDIVDDCDCNDNGNDDDDDDVDMDLLDLLDNMDDCEKVDRSGITASRNIHNNQSNEHYPMTYDINNTLSSQGNLSTRTSSNSQQQQLRGQYPFFDYIDYSQETDLTPDVPLTATGRVPTFLAKLHAILLRPELQSIVRWLPHGRSWKVYDSVAFEKQVINVYFEFTKHPSSSFFRQAKLWGFLRIKQLQNDDYESLYHPRFLRGLPHLCKDVRRPPSSQLPEAPVIDQEPNLSAISDMYPIPSSTNAIKTDPTIHLDWFMKGKQKPMTKSSFSSTPPGKESITKKSSSTSTTTSYTSSCSTIATSTSTPIPAATSIVKRKRLIATTSSSANQRQSSDRYNSTSSGNNNNNIPSIPISDHPMQQQQQQQQSIGGDDSNHLHHSTSEMIGVVHHVPYAYTPYSNYNNSNNINIDIDDSDDEPIDDDLGLNLDPFFAKGYQLYPFYDYIDHSMKVDPYPLQPYTDIGQLPTMPMIVHAILLFQQHQQRNNSTSSNQNVAPIIQWQPHGRAFKICSPSKLEKHILPNFFGTTLGPNHCTTFASFLRHLTHWGFKRIEQRQLPQQQHPHRNNSSNQHHAFSDVDCYYHPKFLRGLPHLCKDWYMNDPSTSILTDIDNDDRTNHTSSDHNDTNNEYPVPDFYKISQLYPIPEYNDANITIDDLMGW